MLLNRETELKCIFLKVMFRNGDIAVPGHQETWQDRGLASCDQLELQPITQTENKRIFNRMFLANLEPVQAQLRDPFNF